MWITIYFHNDLALIFTGSAACILLSLYLRLELIKEYYEKNTNAHIGSLHSFGKSTHIIAKLIIFEAKFMRLDCIGALN